MKRLLSLLVGVPLLLFGAGAFRIWRRRKEDEA